MPQLEEWPLDVQTVLFNRRVHVFTITFGDGQESQEIAQVVLPVSWTSDVITKFDPSKPRNTDCRQMDEANRCKAFVNFVIKHFVVAFKKRV